MSGKNPPLTSRRPEWLGGTNVFESNIDTIGIRSFGGLYFVVDKVSLIAYHVSTVRIVYANTVYRLSFPRVYRLFHASSIKQSNGVRAFLTIISIETGLQLSVENQRERIDEPRVYTFRINRKISRISITGIPRAQSSTTDPAVPRRMFSIKINKLYSLFLRNSTTSQQYV